MKAVKFIYRIIFVIVTFALLAGCHSTKRSHHRHRKNSENIQVLTQQLSGNQKKIIEEAMSWLDAPYAYAKADKIEGTDCSGMVMRVFEDALGYKIPRNSAKQAEFCKPVKARDVESGDLVFFATGKDPERISHVGIMLDKEKFIHSTTSKGVVITPMTSPYFSSHLIMFGRVPYNHR